LDVTFFGIAVRIAAGAPYLRGVILDADKSLPAKTFEYTTSAAADLASQIKTLSDGLAAQLTLPKTTVDRLVLRQGDGGGRAGATTAAVITFRAEGAALYVSRATCADVRVLNGPNIGRACGGDKVEAERQAREIVSADFVIAGSAALAARNL
jgi:hypothetical protein